MNIHQVGETTHVFATVYRGDLDSIKEILIESFSEQGIVSVRSSMWKWIKDRNPFRF